MEATRVTPLPTTGRGTRLRATVLGNPRKGVAHFNRLHLYIIPPAKVKKQSFSLRQSLMGRQLLNLGKPQDRTALETPSGGVGSTVI
ncbi:MAG: hypothetical protein ACRDEA_02910, partial [Microcystaceae cyanobacterium]